MSCNYLDFCTYSSLLEYKREYWTCIGNKRLLYSKHRHTKNNDTNMYTVWGYKGNPTKDDMKVFKIKEENKWIYVKHYIDRGPGDMCARGITDKKNKILEELLR